MSAAIRRYELEKETELRIEVGPNSPFAVRAVAGTAEIFGAELPPQIWIPVPSHHNTAIFTWEGATIEVDGVSEVEYVADETPMVSYVNVHAILDARRIRAAKAAEAAGGGGGDVDLSQGPLGNKARIAEVNFLLEGPRVMVVGPTDSGKSSVCSMLLNWAVKRSWKPTFVDLDVGQGSISIPGCIAATPIKLPRLAVGEIPSELPLVYFYGHIFPGTSTELYKTLVKELAQTVELHFSKDAESRTAGMVINTMGWVEGVGYELLLHAIDTFNANVILVLGQEKLCSMLKDVLKNKQNVDVVKLHKSGGVVPRNAKVRQKDQSLKIREYFYGLVKDLSPYKSTVYFSDISIFKIGGGPKAPRSALPIGQEPVANPTRLVPVNINRELLHSVLAISYAKEPDQILSSNVAGFVYVVNIEVPSQRLTYLAPCQEELPSRILVVGTLMWLESSS